MTGDIQDISSLIHPFSRPNLPNSATKAYSSMQI